MKKEIITHIGHKKERKKERNSASIFSTYMYRKMFKFESEFNKVGYFEFCELRPFWICTQMRGRGIHPYARSVRTANYLLTYFTT